MKKVLIGIFLCSCIAVNAQSDSVASIIEKIRQANLEYTSITSDFTQVRHLSFMNENISSSGKFFYSKPDRLSMKYEQPVGDLMLINNDLLVMISEGKYNKASAKSSSRARTMKNILSSCLQGVVSFIEGVTLSSKETVDSYVITAKLKKKMKSGVDKVVLSYDKLNLTLSTLRMEEPDGSYTMYTLINKVLNQPVDDEVFQAPSKKK
ncbi:MAG: outer membrane lipoprotein carrier protein LolA [Prevotellaceae bacterium]|jgi:outer membrane lipoprotein carrier protein|nr:outer membrane lipoprotein carrier protein LolA [Prevotellaceae bacterium]